MKPTQLLLFFILPITIVACTPEGGSDLYRCSGTRLECELRDFNGNCISFVPVPCGGTLCADTYSEADSFCAGRCPNTSSVTLDMVDGCEPDFAPATDGLLGWQPDYTIRGDADPDPSRSFIDISVNNGPVTRTTITADSNVHFMDTAGPGSAGWLAITSLEIFGDNVVVDGNQVDIPTIFAANAMGGRKFSGGGYTMSRSTVATNSYGMLNGVFHNAGASPGSGSGIGGLVDYTKSELYVSGSVYGTSDDGTPIAAYFAVYFKWTPAPRPVLYVVREALTPWLIRFDASGSSPPQGEEITDYVWYRGNQTLDTGYLDPNDVLGYGAQIDVSSQQMGNDSAVSVYAITDAGHASVAVSCYWDENNWDCYPADTQ